MWAATGGIRPAWSAVCTFPHSRRFTNCSLVCTLLSSNSPRSSSAPCVRKTMPADGQPYRNVKLPGRTWGSRTSRGYRPSEFPLARLGERAIPPAANTRAAVRQVQTACNALGDQRIDPLGQALAGVARCMVDLDQLSVLGAD